MKNATTTTSQWLMREGDDDDDDVSIQKYFEYSKRKIWPDINKFFATTFSDAFFSYLRSLQHNLLRFAFHINRSVPHHQHQHQQESNKRFIRPYNFSFASFSGIFSAGNWNVGQNKENIYTLTRLHAHTQTHMYTLNRTHSDISRPPLKMTESNLIIKNVYKFIVLYS